MRGTDVKAMQTLLVKRGRKVSQDGIFGDQTEAGVKDFQKARWLDADGLVGEDTLNALVTNFGVRLLKEGLTGTDVKEAQRLLKAKGYGLVLDGVFGSATKSAVKSFQRKKLIWPDGVVGPKTAAKLRA
ncbi:peptidoglycan-binding protein [Micromonospora sp. A200]|uniref:peptidoglycan-binding domain-containing protein n=1 Tax=Micromonospora sp. A200 TaxID=2940568 RepID=UPI0032AF10EA